MIIRNLNFRDVQSICYSYTLLCSAGINIYHKEMGNSNLQTKGLLAGLWCLIV